MPSDLFKVPNLISLGRLLFLIPAAYYLSQPGITARTMALAFLLVAVLSDYLDGYFARRLNQQTQLGLVLDPLSDKILVATVIVLLLIHRDFPYWLAVLIIGRDVLILIGTLIFRRKIDSVPPSTITSKYTFAALAILLMSHIIEFKFGITLFTYLSVAFVLLSGFFYLRRFIRVLQGNPLTEFDDRPVYRIIRIILVLIIAAVYIAKLFDLI